MKQWFAIGLVLSLMFGGEVSQAKTETPQKTTAAAKSAKKSKSVEIQPSISFKPDNIIKEVAPGTTLNEKLIIQNNEEAEYQAQVVIVPVFSNDSGRILRVEQTKDKKGRVAKNVKPLPFLKDIEIPTKIITLKSKQTTTVPIAFKIPKDAKGSYYFEYSVQPLTSEMEKIKAAKLKKIDKKSKGAMMGIVVNVFSIGAITVKDNSLLDVSSTTQIKYVASSKQLVVQSKLTNKGNDFAREYAGVAVVAQEGKIIAKFDIKNTQNLTMLLPNSSQMYAGSVVATLVKGNYDVILTFKDFKGQKVSTFKEELKVN